MLIFSAVDSLLGSFQGSREKRDKKIKRSVSAITYTRASGFLHQIPSDYFLQPDNQTL
jgi:hypothetical protein